MSPTRILAVRRKVNSLFARANSLRTPPAKARTLYRAAARREKKFLAGK